ncbi:MAG: PQQ-binding-like beta-propeller repeat protein [Alphaproteobacteria bacterium]|nr:PQQ-binding-like beta-propeller repeat protein [Alphaproteobacteria bacterium]
MAILNGFYAGPRVFNGQGPSTQPSLLWTAQTGDAILCSPAVGPDGRLYVGSKDKRLYALDTATGEVLWSKPTLYPFYYNSAVVDKAGNIYAPGWQTMSWDPDGNERWRTRLTGIVKSSSWLGSQGDLYVTTSPTLGDETGTLYKLDTSTGEVLWSLPVEGAREIMSTPVEVYGNKICFAGPDGTVYGVDKASGEVVTSVALGGLMKCRPGVSPDGKLVHVTTLNNDVNQNRIVALNTGSSNWSVAWDFSPGGMYLSTLTEPLCATSGSHVYAGWYRLLCVSSGRMVWQSDELRYATRLIVDGAGQLYVGRESRSLSAISSNGQLLWTLEDLGLGAGAVIGDEGEIFFGGADGTIYAYGAS